MPTFMPYGPPIRRPFNKDEHGKREAMQRRMRAFRKRIQKQAKRHKSCTNTK